jgi:RNA polymerase sigma-70 factor (ECF subfamily)
MEDKVSIEFAQLLTQNQRRLFGFIFSLVPDYNQANDVLQETNLALCKSADRYDPDKNFTAWAFKVARFQLMAHMKKHKRNRLVFDDELIDMVAEDAEEEAERMEEMRAVLNTCLRKLPTKQRELISSRYEDNASIKSVAKISKRSEGAVTQSLFRIRAALLKCVEREMRKIEV